MNRLGRPVAAAAVAAVAVMVLASFAGCSVSPSSPVSASMTSERRLQAPADSPGDFPRSDDPDFGLDDFGLGDLGLEDFTLDDFGLDDLDRDAIEEGLGELGLDVELDDVEACVELALGYGRLIALAFDGENGAAEIERVLADLREVLPPDLADEMDLIAAKLAEAAAAGWMEATALLSDDEFRAANSAVARWLETECFD